MADLFDTPSAPAPDAPRPLADRLRPKRAGRGDRAGKGPVARRPAGRDADGAGSLSSLILWGPPGVGKTTIARLLAAETDLAFVQISAIFTGVPDLRKVFEQAKIRRQNGQGTLLFVDEIHRFNKAQQDGFLPHMEDGTILLVGATTENPSFELNAALLSRAQVIVLDRLTPGRSGTPGAAGRTGPGPRAAADGRGARGAARHGRWRRPRAAEPDRAGGGLDAAPSRWTATRLPPG